MKTKYVKIMVSILAFLLLTLMQTNPANAQQEKRSNRPQGSHTDSKHEKIEAQRIAFITKELDLTPAEAKIFWPVYNEYNSKRHELRNSSHNSDDLTKEEIEKLTEKEASQILEAQITEVQKYLDLRKEYHTKFKSVLPAVKVLKLYNAEREFQKMLIDKLRQNNQKPPADKK